MDQFRNRLSHFDTEKEEKNTRKALCQVRWQGKKVGYGCLVKDPHVKDDKLSKYFIITTSQVITEEKFGYPYQVVFESSRMKTFNLLDIMKSSTFGVPTPSDASVYDEGGNEDGQISRGDGNDDHYKPKKPIFLGSTLVAVLIDSKSPHLRRRFSHRKCSILKNLPHMALVNDKKKFFYFNAKHKKCTYCIGNGDSPEHGTVLFQSTDTHKAMSAVGMFHSSSSIRPELRNTLQEILEDEKPRKEMEELKIRKKEEEQDREDGEEEGKKKDTNSTIQHNLGDSPTTRTDVTSSEIKQSSKDKRKIGDRRRRGTIDKGGGNEDEEREEEPDFTDLMKKLVKASTLGFNELRNVSNSIKLPPLDVNRNIYFSPGETDNVSQNLMPESKRDRGYVAIATGPDGNCFFRSASLLICGNEDRHQEMRVRTVIELARNKHHYLSDPNIGPRLRAQEQYRFNDKTPINPDNVKVEAKAVEAEFETDLANICKNSVWASDWHFSALANILRCPVESVFPECGEQVGEYLNCVYQPKEEPLVIMWTRTESQGKDAKFEPNHFVPLVPNKMVRSLEKGGGNEDEKRVEPDGGAPRGSTSSDNKARKHGGEKEGQHTSTDENATRVEISSEVDGDTEMKRKEEERRKEEEEEKKRKEGEYRKKKEEEEKRSKEEEERKKKEEEEKKRKEEEERKKKEEEERKRKDEEERKKKDKEEKKRKEGEERKKKEEEEKRWKEGEERKKKEEEERERKEEEERKKKKEEEKKRKEEEERKKREEEERNSGQRAEIVTKSEAHGEESEQVNDPEVELVHAGRSRLLMSVKDIPLSVYSEVCVSLNVQRHLRSDDFRMLGDKVGLSRDEIEFVGQRENPADEILKTWSSRPREATVAKLIELLKHKDFGRMDVAQILEDWVDSKER